MLKHTAGNTLKELLVRDIKNLLHDEKDQQFLFRILNDYSLTELHAEAVKGLTDQNLLLDIMQHLNSDDIRRDAFGKLDSPSLEKLLTMTSDKSVTVAAKIKLNRTTWDSEIDSRAQKVETIVGAMALFDNDMQLTTGNVVKVCYRYIREGNESKIPELRDLLMRYGDKTLAEDFLNCGKNKLYEIGVEWCRGHGYNVDTGPGSSRVRWGGR